MAAISTSRSERASLASTVARAGACAWSTQASQTSLNAAKLFMSVSQMFTGAHEEDQEGRAGHGSVQSAWKRIPSTAVVG